MSEPGDWTYGIIDNLGDAARRAISTATGSYAALAARHPARGSDVPISIAWRLGVPPSVEGRLAKQVI